MDGVAGEEERFLSAETALFDRACELDEDTVVLVTLGEGHLRVLVGVGEGDLYLELTSIVLDRRGTATALLFFSAGTRGGLVVSVTDD